MMFLPDLPNIDVWAVAALCVLISGLSKAGIVGLGILATPLLAIGVQPSTALAIMLPVMIFQDVLGLVRFRRSVRRDLLVHLLLGAVPGVFFASVVILIAEPCILAIMLGLMPILFALWGQDRQIAKHRETGTGLAAWVAGLGSGLTSALANAGTPPVHFYLMRLGVGKEQFIAVSVYFFAAVNLIKLPAFAGAGLFDRQTLTMSTLLLPFSALGWMLGLWIVHRLSQKPFSMVVRASLVLVGLVLILRNLPVG